MFQFRPFPPYTYLIQCTVTRYCRVGFPHSEIHGYNGYLLLPAAYRSLSRPSSAPDAKAFPLRSFQLDRRRRGLRITRPPRKREVSLAPSRLLFLADPLTLGSARMGTGERFGCPYQRVIRDLVLLELCRQFNGRFKIRNCYPAPFRMRSTIKTKTLLHFRE